MPCTMHCRHCHHFHHRSLYKTSSCPVQHQQHQSTTNTHTECCLQNAHFILHIFLVYIFSFFSQHRLTIGFHFLAFACGYFEHFSSLWWSQAPGDFYYIAHNSIHSKRCQPFFRVSASTHTIFSSLSGRTSFFLFAADLPSFILKHNERTMAISLIRWSIGMQ